MQFNDGFSGVFLFGNCWIHVKNSVHIHYLSGRKKNIKNFREFGKLQIPIKVKGTILDQTSFMIDSS